MRLEGKLTSALSSSAMPPNNCQNNSILGLWDPKASLGFVKGEIQQKENKLWSSPEPSSAPSCLLFAESWCYFSHVVILNVLLQYCCGHWNSCHYCETYHCNPMFQGWAFWPLLLTYMQGMKKSLQISCVCVCVCVCVCACVLTCACVVG